jgi:uncharacterized small protein (DUF1192 family)
LRSEDIGIDFTKKLSEEPAMFDDDNVKKPKGHEVGMPIDTMSVEELTDRIELLQAEIARLELAIAARRKTRAAADSLFKL